MLRKIWSWLVNIKIGECKYRKASPFITGNLGLILPAEFWTKEDRHSIRLHVHRYVWTGFSWKYDGRHAYTKYEYNALAK